MVTGTHKIKDDAVSSGKIAGDTVIAADIAAGGVDTSELADQGVTGAKASTAGFMQMGQVTADATGGTTVSFSPNMTGTPKVFATVADGSTANTIGISSVSTASFDIATEAAGTVDWVAIANV